MISTSLEADVCSLYLYQDGELSLDDGIPEVKYGRPEAIGIEHPLISHVICEHRVMTIKDRLVQSPDKCIKQPVILMAGPLTLSHGRVYGVVVIESTAFHQTDTRRCGLYECLLNWASLTLENVLLSEQNRLRFGDDEMLRKASGCWDFALEEEGVGSPG